MMQHRGSSLPGATPGGQHGHPCAAWRPGPVLGHTACWPGSNSFLWCPVPGWSSKGWVSDCGHPGDPFPLSQPGTCCSLREDNSWVPWDISSSSLQGVQCPPRALCLLPMLPTACQQCLRSQQPVCHVCSPAIPCPSLAVPCQALAVGAAQGSREPRAPAGHCKLLHSPHLPRPPSTRLGSHPREA